MSGNLSKRYHGPIDSFIAAEYVLRRYHHGFILDVSPDEKILSPDGVNGIFFCKFSASGTFTDVCYDVDEDIVEANGCHVQIGAESDFSKLRPRGYILLHISKSFCCMKSLSKM